MENILYNHVQTLTENPTNSLPLLTVHLVSGSIKSGPANKKWLEYRNLDHRYRHRKVQDNNVPEI